MVKKSVIKKDNLKKSVESDLGNEKLLAFIATFLSIIGFIIVLITKSESKYVRYYAKQSLVIFLFSLICFLIGQAILFVPIIGPVIQTLLNALAIAAWVVSWIFALSGKMREVPIIGKYASSIRL